MRGTQFRFLTLALALVFLLAACKARTSTTNSSNSAKLPPNASSNANPSANSNKSGQPPSSEGKDNSKPANADSSPQLAGTYQAREIRDQGITTIVSESRSLISFFPDGTYSRVAQRKDGTTYHADSGKFRVNAPDKLLLTIEVSDKKIQSPPLHRMHKFSLSEDGDQLKLTNEKGGVAVYRRIARTKTS